MSEPAKENPKASKRSRRRPAMQPLGWDEIVSQPGMGGYLSFLNGPVPLPHLQGSAAVLVKDPGVISDPQLETAPDIARSPDVLSIAEPVPNTDSVRTAQVETNPEITSLPEIDLDPGVISSPDGKEMGFVRLIPEVVSTPPLVPTPGITHSVAPVPEVVSIPAVPSQRLRIRRCGATHDGHSLGEEVLYQALWKAAHPESAAARTIVIGWRGMSQLCRMTPKNCKINTQRLIRKLALEVLSPYNTPESIGTTYRVYSDDAILRRRREAGLEWVVRSRGVEFVDPATGVSIMPICAHTY
jgi:hypothetical protein